MLFVTERKTNYKQKGISEKPEKPAIEWGCTLCVGLCSDVGCSLNEGERCDLSSKRSGLVSQA